MNSMEPLRIRVTQSLWRRFAFLACMIVAFGPLRADAAASPTAVSGLAAWYDGSVAASLTKNPATLVSQWNDLSGHGNNLSQTEIGLQPILGPTLNGKNTLEFNGYGQGMTTAGNVGVNGNGARSLFVVQYQGVLTFGNTGGDDGGGDNFYDANDLYLFDLHDSGMDNGAFSADYNKWNILSAIHTTAGSASSSFVNSYTGVTATTVIATSAEPLFVGTGVDGFSNYGGFAEIILYSTNLSTANRQKLEAYLACKWGLAAELNPANPNSTAAPCGGGTFSETTPAAPLLWYDASNAGSLTTAPATQVTAWADQSGNGHNATLANNETQNDNRGNPPRYVAANAVTFADGYEGLAVAQPGFLSGNRSIFAVYGTSSPSGCNTCGSQQGAGVVDSDIGGPQADWGFDVGDGYPNVGDSSTSVDISTINSPTSILGGAMHLVDSTYNSATGAAMINVDGGTQTTGTEQSGARRTDVEYELGRSTTQASQGLQGAIEEIDIYNRVLNPTEYYYVEGYLACKWGLQGNLPASHPWKTACPGTTLSPSFTLSQTVSPTGNQPPGAVLTYTTTYTNISGQALTTLVVNGPVPANTYFQVGSASSNQMSNGLTVATAYSNNGGSTYAYTPVSAGGGAPAGYDATVTNVRWTFTGSLSQTSPNNTGTTTYAVMIK